jgi:hypothetical protein
VSGLDGRQSPRRALSISNGLPLCLFHHWLVHEGGWRVSKHPGATVTALPPPPGRRPGTIYHHGKPFVL